VAIGGGNANAALGLAGTESDNGVDVAGSFLVDGVSEPAAGHGQFLIGNSPNANTADLQVRVTLTPAQVTAGTTGTVTVSRGIASQLDAQLDNLLDPVNGTLKNIDDGFNDQVADLEKRKTQQTALLNDQVTRLQNEFTQMEQTLSQLQSSSGFLLQQANSLSAPKSSSSSSSSSSS
jgi:flagellar hook-associated protein 2